MVLLCICNFLSIICDMPHNYIQIVYKLSDSLNVDIGKNYILYLFYRQLFRL